jgi:hydrogenase 3 maturation protease
MRIVVCGIGNILRADDGVGPAVIEKLKPQLQGGDVLLLDCGSTPENYLKTIEKFKPDLLVIIDTVELKKPPGTVETIETEKIVGEMMSTHKLPVSLFIKYLQKSLDSEIIFIGVQPKTTLFVDKMSSECVAAVEKVAERVVEIVGGKRL